MKDLSKLELASRRVEGMPFGQQWDNAIRGQYPKPILVDDTEISPFNIREDWALEYLYQEEGGEG
jgi:hypothetical protein